jgi:hypothetical protein
MRAVVSFMLDRARIFVLEFVCNQWFSAQAHRARKNRGAFPKLFDLLQRLGKPFFDGPTCRLIFPIGSIFVDGRDNVADNTVGTRTSQMFAGL